MSSKFDLKKLARRAEAKATTKATIKTPLSTGGKGIHISERPPKKAKTTRDATLEASPSKGKTPPKVAKTVKFAGSLDQTTSRVTPACSAGGEEGTLVHLGAAFGLEASVVKDPAVAEKLTQAFLLPVDKKMSGKMELDEIITQFYHVYYEVLMMGSSLAE
ncbi:uncharacterized protein LOC130788358 [Actinidia eriantha]|uniref:uncharacterized protein LOC130788358 n=1 Tax=Actinidia eriantha TaxID=165200 RepID=UPI002586A00D|nr:uncharacterized protein LOC130788358 [Actinidia eriantha]